MVIKGPSGNDHLHSNGLLQVGADIDYLHGNTGNDFLPSGDGNDALFGNESNDVLLAGAGGDFLRSGAGDDTYCYTQTSDSTVSAVDTMKTFSLTQILWIYRDFQLMLGR